MKGSRIDAMHEKPLVDGQPRLDFPADRGRVEPARVRVQFGPRYRIP
jgi:hypothetical protein